MSNPYLVVVHAGDRSLHPQWLATAAERNWDLIVHYYGDRPMRYPIMTEGVVRIDGKGPKWPTLYGMLDRTYQAWRNYEYVWFPDESLIASCEDINRMFEIVSGLGLHLAQPSYAWTSRDRNPLTVHNPAFSLRYSSFVDTQAPLLSRRFLERVAPSLTETVSGADLGYLWPRLLDNAATDCAILDCVQVHAVANFAELPAQELASRQTSALAQGRVQLGRFGVTERVNLSYGGVDSTGARSNLFEATGDRFVYRLCAGYLGCNAFDPAQLGALFAAHVQARKPFLDAARAADTAARGASAATVAPAGRRTAAGVSGAASAPPAQELGYPVAEAPTALVVR